jgi:hypothetical protein
MGPRRCLSSAYSSAIVIATNSASKTSYPVPIGTSRLSYRALGIN